MNSKAWRIINHWSQLRAAKYHVKADLTRSQWERILQAHSHRCAYCGKLPDRMTQDHIIALSKGGSHTESNVIPACFECNQAKGVDGPEKHPTVIRFQDYTPRKPKARRTIKYGRYVG